MIDEAYARSCRTGNGFVIEDLPEWVLEAVMAAIGTILPTDLAVKPFDWFLWMHHPDVLVVCHNQCEDCPADQMELPYNTTDEQTRQLRSHCLEKLEAYRQALAETNPNIRFSLAEGGIGFMPYGKVSYGE